MSIASRMVTESNWNRTILTVGFGILLLVLIIVTLNIYTENRESSTIANAISAIDNSCTRPASTFRQRAGMRIIVDLDNDLIDDYWEDAFRLNPLESADSYLDLDGDGYSNLEEFEAGTNPREIRSYPGITKITSQGFDCFYTAGVGMVNNDNLIDIVIRDPSEGILPMIRDVVLIQQPDKSFVLHDAHDFQLPDTIAINETILLVELNGDSAMDLALLGLSDYIPGVNDQILFAPTCHLCSYQDLGEMPQAHAGLGQAEVSFFNDLSQWVNSFHGVEDYFEDNATVVASVPQLVDLSWAADAEGSVISSEYPISTSLTSEYCEDSIARCSNVVADESDYNGENIYETLSVAYTPDAYQISIVDKDNNPNERDVYFLVKSEFSMEDEVSIRDYSEFNEEAVYLAKNEFKTILESGVMWFPSIESENIYNILSKNLGGVQVFPDSYEAPNFSKYRAIEWGDVRTRNIAGSIQAVLHFVAVRYTRYPDQNF